MSCCEGLKLNKTTGLCEDPIKDSTLIYCAGLSTNPAAGDTDCGTKAPGLGLGCFRMSEDDFFSKDVNQANQMIPQSDSQDTVDDDRDKFAKDDDSNPNLDGAPDGSSCKASSECDSYFCDPTAKTCQPKFICRRADIAESVRAGVRCEDGLIVTTDGKCDLSEADKQLYYMGLIESDVTVKTTNACDLREYQKDPQMADIRTKSIVSMKTLRAMEWLFATSSLEDSQECLEILPLLRDNMAKTFNEERKKILTNFNIEMSKIEADSETLKNASENSKGTVSIHGDTIAEKDLATRRSSGYDALKLMWRRNLLFQSYEKAMTEIITTAGATLGGLAEEMQSWKDKSKKWTVDGKEWTYKTAGKCRGKKAKKIKKRWTNFYQVNATSEANSAVVKSKTIADYLSLVSGDSSDSVVSTLINGPKNSRLSNYFLIDPLMPGDKGSVSFEQFGTGKSNKRQLNADAYPEMRKVFRERIQAFYLRMKGEGAPANFVYEPEIIKMEARDCIEKPSGPNCELYTAFLDEMTDIAMAQFLAYSIHSKNSYKRYFSATNLRRKLLAKYSTDMQNVVKYYNAMSTARDEQTSCLEKSMNQIVAEVIDDGAGVLLDTKTDSVSTGTDATGTASTTSGSTSASSGAVNSSRSETTTNAASAGSSSSTQGSGLVNKTTKTSLRVTSSSKNPFIKDLRSSLTATSNIDSMAGTTTSSAKTAGTSFGNAASTKQFATRLVAMKTTNSLAASKGISLSSKEKAVASSLASLSQSTGNSAGSASKAPSKLASNGLNAQTVAELEMAPKDIEKEAAMILERRAIEAGKAAAPATASTGYGAPAVTPGSATQADLSETDQEVIEANYERTKAEYRSAEEDDLFDKVSKAYVRNLDKILKKKKQIED